VDVVPLTSATKIYGYKAFYDSAAPQILLSDQELYRIEEDISSLVFIRLVIKVIIIKMIRATFIGSIEDGLVFYEKIEHEEDLEDNECKLPDLDCT
jgi:hypothetical protein